MTTQETIQTITGDYLDTLSRMVADGRKRKDPTLAVALSIETLGLLVQEVSAARETTPAGVLDEPDPRMGAVEAAFFALARDFTYTGPHDPETAHAIVAEHRPAIEAAILQAIRLADAALASAVPAGVLDEAPEPGRIEWVAWLEDQLAASYVRDRSLAQYSRAFVIAELCDEFLDRSGAMLGHVRDKAAALGRSGSGGGRG